MYMGMYVGSTSRLVNNLQSHDSSFFLAEKSPLAWSDHCCNRETNSG